MRAQFDGNVLPDELPLRPCATGPAGGVRADGNCEVKPDMKCVWVEAYRGSERIPAAPRP